MNALIRLKKTTPVFVIAFVLAWFRGLYLPPKHHPAARAVIPGSTQQKDNTPF